MQLTIVDLTPRTSACGDWGSGSMTIFVSPELLIPSAYVDQLRREGWKGVEQIPADCIHVSPTEEEAR